MSNPDPSALLVSEAAPSSEAVSSATSESDAGGDDFQSAYQDSLSGTKTVIEAGVADADGWAQSESAEAHETIRALRQKTLQEIAEARDEHAACVRAIEQRLQRHLLAPELFPFAQNDNDEPPSTPEAGRPAQSTPSMDILQAPPEHPLVAEARSWSEEERQKRKYAILAQINDPDLQQTLATIAQQRQAFLALKDQLAAARTTLSPLWEAHAVTLGYRPIKKTFNKTVYEYRKELAEKQLEEWYVLKQIIDRGVDQPIVQAADTKTLDGLTQAIEALQHNIASAGDVQAAAEERYRQLFEQARPQEQVA